MNLNLYITKVKCYNSDFIVHRHSTAAEWISVVTLFTPFYYLMRIF